jgi:SAM-dependent methyltransferase
MKLAAKLRDRVMETSVAYRLLQAPFADRKLAPVLRDPGVRRANRVLDLACGPGTNAHHFALSSYTGVDINRSYIEVARSRHEGRFIVADATDSDLLSGESFDLVLLNSFLHHLPDEAVRRTLARVNDLLAPDGRVHVLDLILPARPSVAKMLARLDRGDFARPLGRWASFLDCGFHGVSMEPFTLTVACIPLWHMFHFKGTKRLAA